EQLSSEFAELLQLRRSEGRPQDALADLKRKALPKQTKTCEGRLSDLGKLPSLNAHSRLQQRDIHLSLERSDGQVTLFFYDKELGFPDFVLPEIEFIVAGREFRIADLPGTLDDESKQVLVRKLIEE